VKDSEKGDLFDFERGQIVGANLAGAFVTKTTTLLGVLRVTVSKVMSAAYMSHGKTTSVKKNGGRKSTLTERDCHTLRKIVSKNHATTAVLVTVELNIHLEDSVSTTTLQCDFHKFNIYGRAAIAKPLFTESNPHLHI
jgi:preprotein translocase subunit SecG